MIYGYVRPLYDDRESENQLAALAGRYDELFQETHGSPKKRVELDALLMVLEPGDCIIVERMAALADTFHHLMDILKLCEKDGVRLHFLKEGIKSDELLSMSLKEMMAHVLDFQSDTLKQSTTIGMRKAKKSGKTIGRPKKSDENVNRAIKMYHDGETLIDIKNETGISKSTLYRYLESPPEEE